ncbi:sensor histidine kinase [Actinoplanes sp. GCM10030250]|uniref:sensor histidine kinase n=1 Tax=Actinoplanes sp. GCM10030250 TaxID=3273376 RepID=UPI0036239993
MALLVLTALFFVAYDELSSNRDLPDWFTTVLAAGSVVPVLLAPRWPLLAWRIAFPMLFLGVIDAPNDDSWPWNVVQILGFLFIQARLAAVSESMITIWATALALVPVFAFAPDANAYGAALLIVTLAALGDIVSRRRRTSEILAEQSELNEQERAKRAVLEERARIAREMHDVVAHHMSMIAVQAETAPYRVDDLPEAAKEELTSIAAAAREALTDMRRLLGVLRAEEDQTLKTPQPGYAQITALVSTAQRAGLPVTTDLPAVEDLPEAVGLTAYRIVQEALANAARHAPGGPVRLRARVDPALLELHVRNELTGPVQTGKRGHGLVGMRERVALLGGDLTAGPDGAGGYQVTARLPRQPQSPGTEAAAGRRHREPEAS